MNDLKKKGRVHILWYAGMDASSEANQEELLQLATAIEGLLLNSRMTRKNNGQLGLR